MNPELLRNLWLEASPFRLALIAGLLFLVFAAGSVAPAQMMTSHGAALGLYWFFAVLWGTISSKRRDDPAAIRDYFVNAYKALPELTVTFEDPKIRVYGGDTAVNTGYYTFSYEKDGAMQSLPARYSFTLVKRDGEWQIVDHHSSAMPQPPQ